MCVFPRLEIQRFRRANGYKRIKSETGQVTFGPDRVTERKYDVQIV